MNRRTNLKNFLVISAFLLGMGCATAAGRTIYVDDDGTAEFDNIQAAIDDSCTIDGDTIEVQPGNYTGTGNRDIDPNGKAITIRSTDPNDPNVVAATVIDCNGSETEQHRAFYFHSGEEANSVLSGLTITNGYVTDLGGGIRVLNSSPTISNCTITSNWVQWGLGGGIYSFNSSLKISNCTIMGNSAAWGGGITCSGSGSPIISHCAITGNSAASSDPYGLPSGGGIYTSTGGLKINNCTISGNSAPAWGGGIHCDASCTISHCTITGNSGSSWGGGLSCYNSSPKINHCIITGNSGSSGGGIRCEQSSAKINCCIITGNSADYGGGISCEYGGSPNISNCTVSGNDDYYGGIFCHSSSPIVTNCILWDDTPSEIYVFASGTPVVTYCDVQGSYTGIGNIDSDPCFVDAANGDYHLQSQAGRWDPNSQTWVIDSNTSPCIDAGNPGCPEANEPAPNGNRINMGAYGGTAEASKSPANWRNIADLTNDWVVDFNDLKVFVDYWLETGRCIPSDLNRSRTVDFNDFAIFSGQWQEKGPGPGITYEVDECIPVELGLFAVEQTGQTRFSVWVEGSYIHFEDLITANCCADEIELQMTVEDNLITIHEIEHLTIPCDCICDYPVTATLGPFEEGNYLVEVIDVNGYSIGVVEVTIGGPIEPSITYQIEDCNQEASGLFAAEEDDQTRFTVTVEGMYIHFEDMMTANCCPDELELQMTVEDNLITIYEIEHLTAPCFCICDYPVTATLGPFEPGTYILEVYEDWGGFIGRTTVTIDPIE